MKVSYKKLWVMLIERDITKAQMRKDLGFAAGTMSKMNKGEEVSMSVLLKRRDLSRGIFILKFNRTLSFCSASGEASITVAR